MATIGYGYGSEWHLLQYLGRRREAFTKQVSAEIGCSNLAWLDHQEYQDHTTAALKIRERRGLDFLPVGDPVREEWQQLWPQSGNVHNWDAVGRAGSGKNSTWLLVEAKAHTGELPSSCTAKSNDSVKSIRQVLERVQQELGVAEQSDWMNGYYQYCNRIGLLHFLLSHKVDAHLMFVYFTGDRLELGSPGRECPASEAGWQQALDLQERYVGLPLNAGIKRFIHRLFLPAYLTEVRKRRFSNHPGVALSDDEADMNRNG